MKVPGKVLVVQPYGIGDLLFLTPVFRALKKAGVKAVDLLLGSRTEAVVRANPHVRKIIRIDKDHYHRQGKVKTFFEIAGLTGRLRLEEYDLMLDYSMRGEYGFWAHFFLGIHNSSGLDYKRRGFFHNRKLAIPGGFQGRHVVDYYCEVAEKAGIPVQDRALEFFLTEKDREHAGNVLASKGVSGRFVVVSAGGGESWGKDAHFKRWPVKHFAGLLERLRKQSSFESAVVLGSSAESALAEELKNSLSFSCVSLCGEVPLETAAAIIKKAVLFCGNDGGLTHLAHALKTPLIALFGPVDPVVYGPYPADPRAVVCFKKDLECRPCYQKFRYNSACEKRECLQELTPEEVMAVLRQSQFQQA